MLSRPKHEPRRSVNRIIDPQSHPLILSDHSGRDRVKLSGNGRSMMAAANAKAASTSASASASLREGWQDRICSMAPAHPFRRTQSNT